MSAIRLESVTVRLGDTTLLDAVDLATGARRIAVVGDNGSGKSTLARVIGGLVVPTAGRVLVNGADPARRRKNGPTPAAFVFSNPDAQIIMPTVREDVAFSLRAERLSRSESAARTDAALEEFGLAHLAARSAHELSGGQKQLLALCGAFVRRPELVVADEPTALLDARNGRRVADHLLEGPSHRLVLVTHDLALAGRCDAAVLVDGGRILAVDDAAAVVRHYERSLAC
ncbi:energy-coupling factor ABC transporter ATP-binding protein [Zafaria sp. Z1313]|uniref:energy-coupling factor ABC transporter ATP-binding protein n=1 Tax=unclassified Zafaria TaxID=2828765 RepID=UPI002E7807B6|nr:ABC transporter ATP-binding protein [Zafaria sp. J156]MEE1620870.1 ABC transporter ATP-binding protein [Zafaria sp. J156]